MNMKWEESDPFSCLIFACVTWRYFTLWEIWKTIWSDSFNWFWDLGKAFKTVHWRARRCLQAPPCYTWQASLFRKQSNIVSHSSPFTEPWESDFRFYSLRGNIWVACARGLLLSGRKKPSQLVTCAEAPKGISPVSTVKLEHSNSKLWPISIISPPTTSFSWPLFYSDSRPGLGAA